MTDVKHRIKEADRNIDAKNAAHYVYYEIEKLDDNLNPEDVRKRWIWELLQNALDSRGTDGIIAEVRYDTSAGELIFLHNGRGFEVDEILHLIKGGTSKDKGDKKTRGKFGRGFLTTFLLSPTVTIMGQLDKNLWFNFTLKRDFTPGGDSEAKDDLAESLKASLDAFEDSISDDKPAIPEGFTTQFIFPICGPKSEEAVNEGIDALEQCAPYVIVFNREFSSINLKKPDNTKSFMLDGGDPKLDASGIQQVTIVKNDTKMEYLLAESKQQEASVAVRMKSNEGNPVCLRLNENIPRLFSALPLVGTKSLSFPAVINSPDFSLPPDRDSVQFDKNRDFIEEAGNLLVSLIEHAARERWDHVHQWAGIPYISSLSDQMGSGWETCIKNLIERIYQTPAVHTLSGEPKSPLASILPETETEKSDNVVVLWDLLKYWQEYRGKLPRRDEAIGWYNALQSWGVYRDKAFNGLQLAKDIQACSSLKVLRNMLQEGICAIEWLDRFYDFLKKDELFDNAIRNYSFVPNQVEKFRQLSSLHRDNRIDKELKDISEIIGKNIRQNLRYTPLASLEDEDGRDDLDNTAIVGDLIDNIKNNVNENLHNGTNFKEASVRLFAWIVRNKQYALLPDFTVFAKEDATSEKPTIIRLPHPNQDDHPDKEIPLAPVKVWNNDLQYYSQLFPRRYILANNFYDAVPEEDIWQTLHKKKIIRKDVVIRYPSKVSFEEFQPHDPLTREVEHESEKEITISNIAFLTKKDIGVIDKVRKNRSLAYKFWCFLTEWLVVHDSKALEIIEDVPCICKDTHRCYPAQWLKHVVNRKWVALGEDNAAYVEVEVLVKLLQDNKWNSSTLIQNDHIGKLLEAIGISRFDFMRETLVDKSDHNAVDNAMIEIVRKSDGDVNHLNHAIKYIEAVTSNENLPQDLEDLLEATDGDISEVTEIAENLQEDEEFKQVVDTRLKERRNIKQNQSLGITVEEIVGDHLKELNESFEVEVEDFEVDPIHKGADYVITLEINQEELKWWIEVKSARTDRVKMSSDQAQNAKERGENFLLCVVPLEPGNTDPDPETVKENMRFIADINNRVAPLCKKIDELKDVQTNINAESTSDVELVIEGGKASVIVKKSVWESDEAFPLQKLAEYLR